MTFTELVEAVYVETNRPDMVAETQNAILSSLLKLHCCEFFYKDIAQTDIVFDEARYVQTLGTNNFPRYRSLCYFRKNDPTLAAFQQNPSLLPPLYSSAGLPTSTSMGFLKVITPDNIFDEYNAEKLDVCYQAGQTLFMKSGTALQFGLVGYYQFPNLSPTNPTQFTSWIATEMPWAVVYDAASAVLQKIGMTDAARKYDNPENGLAPTHRHILIMNNIVMNGY